MLAIVILLATWRAMSLIVAGPRMRVISCRNYQCLMQMDTHFVLALQQAKGTQTVYGRRLIITNQVN